MSFESNEMTVELEELERWRRRLTVTVAAEAVGRERSDALRKLGGRLKLKGFRKGRVPSGLIEQRYGPAVEQDVLERLIREAYRSAVDEESLHPISEGSLHGVDFQPGSDLRFSIDFDVQPEISLNRLGGFSVKRPQFDVEDAQVRDVLEQLRRQNGAWTPREEGAPGAEDLVTVEIHQLDENGEPGETQNYEFVLGQGDAIPDVEEAIRSLEIGSVDDFRVRFPDDFSNEARRGQEEHLRIQLVARRELELPELDDEFAKGLGDFESLADLEGRIREDLRKEADGRAEAGVRSEILDLVVDSNHFEVPASMVSRYIDSLLGGPDADVPEERRREAHTALSGEAERAVKRILVIERVAELKELRATQEEVDSRVEAIAEQDGTSPAQVYARLQKAGRIEALEREITEDKVFDFLKKESEIIEAA